MQCICIENNYNNTDFTVGKIYEYKEDGHIRTNWGNMWAKNYEPFRIEDNTFECGMCKFRASKQKTDLIGEINGKTV